MAENPKPGGPIRILALIEAASVTGPVKNLLTFHETARGVELMVATFRRGDVSGDDAFLTAAAAAGLRLEVIRERGRFDFGNVRWICEIARECRPDVIQTHGVKSHFLVRWSGLWHRIPWVAFHHGYTSTDLKMRLYNQLNRWSLRAPRRIIAVSGAFARELTRSGVPAGRIAVIHNAVDPCFEARVAAAGRTAVRSSLGIAPGERVVLAVGRLSHEKAIQDLVAAMPRISGERARLVVVGDGPERAAIERAAGSLRVPLTMVGQVRDVAPFYAIADVLALPSLSEGSPNALLEAMAAGVPAVATAVGGVPEIVTDGETALLVPPRAPEALAGAITRMLNDAGLSQRLANNARARVRAHYSPEARAARLVALYTEMLAEQ